MKGLSWREWLEVGHIAVIAAVVEVCLRTSTLVRTAKILHVGLDFEETSRGAEPVDPLPAWAVHRLELTRALFRRWPGGPTCLRLSLVGASRLRPLQPKLRVGVAREGAGMRAHAWIEIDGQCLDTSAAGFEPVHWAAG